MIRKRECVGALVLGAIVSAQAYAGVASSSIIPEGCDPFVIVAHAPACYCDSSTDSGVAAEAPRARSRQPSVLEKTTAAEEAGCDVAPAGLHVERLITCDALTQAMDRTRIEGGEWTGGLDGALRVTRDDGSALTDDDIATLQAAGYDDLAPVCDITAMSQQTVEEAQPWIAPDTWHLIETGTADVTAYLSSVDEHVDTVTSLAPVRVAVVDSGVDPVVGTGLLAEGWAGSEDTCQYEDPWLCDGAGHGTATAFLVLESAGGVAEILSIRVLDDLGIGRQDTLALGIVQAVAMGADILNLSLGWPLDATRADGGLPWYVADALTLATAAGVPLVAAAGNRCRFGNDADCGRFYPASAPARWRGNPIDVIAVGGVTPEGTPSTQSVDEGIDVWAPSEYICARTAPGAGVNGWQRLSGTSMAAPQVSGALALLMVHRPEQPLTTPEHALMSSPAGLLNLCRAMGAVGRPVPSCRAWEGLAGPEEGLCNEYGVEDSVRTASLTVESGEAFPDQTGEGFWCAGGDVHAQPDNPPCTSCDYCREGGPGGMRVTGLTLRVHLRRVPDFEDNANLTPYLRLSLANPQEYRYVPLDSVMEDLQQGHTTFSFSLYDLDAEEEISEVWFMVGTDESWAGQPLLDVGVEDATAASRTIKHCD